MSAQGTSPRGAKHLDQFMDQFLDQFLDQLGMGKDGDDSESQG
jgi:hypothetical protein